MVNAAELRGGSQPVARDLWVLIAAGLVVVALVIAVVLLSAPALP
jgi:hypothetical protein